MSMFRRIMLMMGQLPSPAILEAKLGGSQAAPNGVWQDQYDYTSGSAAPNVIDGDTTTNAYDFQDTVIMVKLITASVKAANFTIYFSGAGGTVACRYSTDGLNWTANDSGSTSPLNLSVPTGATHVGWATGLAGRNVREIVVG